MDEDYRVFQTIPWHPFVTTAALGNLTCHRHPGFLRLVNARHPARSVRELEINASSKQVGVRMLTALNTATPAFILAKLATDKSKDVRYCVPWNRNTPVRVLEQLIVDPLRATRQDALARYSGTPIEKLRHMATLKNIKLRRIVAENPSLPADLLTKLADDRCPFMRAGVAGNANTPVSLLKQLLADEHEDVRQAAATNPGFLMITDDISELRPKAPHAACQG